MLDERKKTTIRIPHELSLRVDEWGKRLGIGTNGFYSIASMMLLAEASKLETRSKRSKLLKELESNFQRVVKEARKRA